MTFPSNGIVKPQLHGKFVVIDWLLPAVLSAACFMPALVFRVLDAAPIAANDFSELKFGGEQPSPRIIRRSDPVPADCPRAGGPHEQRCERLAVVNSR